MVERTGFRDVKAEILRRIRDKTWPPGALMPNETDLAAELSCARATVNRAMRELAEQGVLDRKRKAGTRVAAAPVRRAELKIPLIRAEVEGEGAAYSYELIHRKPCPVPEFLSPYGVTGEVLSIACLHLSDGQPYQLEDRYISLTSAPAAAAQDFTVLSPNEWLIAEIPFTDVEVSFTAQAASDTEAAHLNQPPGSPIFVAERATWADGRFITFVRLSHPGAYRMTTSY